MNKTTQGRDAVKMEAFNLVNSGMPKTSVAKQLNIPESTLRGWVKSWTLQKVSSSLAAVSSFSGNTNIMNKKTQGRDAVKMEAFNLVNSGMPKKFVAKQLNIPESTFRGWVKSWTLQNVSSSLAAASSFSGNTNIMNKKTQVPDAVKMEAFNLVNSGMPKKSVAKQLNIPESTLRGWVKSRNMIRTPLIQTPLTVSPIESSLSPALPPAPTSVPDSLPSQYSIVSSSDAILDSVNSQSTSPLSVATLFSNQELDDIISNFLSPIPSITTDITQENSPSFTQAYLHIENVLRFNSYSSYPRLPKTELDKYEKLLSEYSKLANQRLNKVEKKKLTGNLM